MSASVNKVLLVGNLGADPEIRYLPSGTPVANLSVATSARRRQADGSAVEQVEWHRVSLFGNLADVARVHLRKGIQVYVEGRIRTDTWRESNGSERKMVVIVAHRLMMLGRKEGERTQAASLADDMSWLDEAAPGRQTTTDDDDVPF